MTVKNDHRSKFFNLSSCITIFREEATSALAGKKQPEKNQGFNGIRTRDRRDTSAILYPLKHEATHWERGQLVEFISHVRLIIVHKLD